MTLRSKFAIAVLGLSISGALCGALSQTSVKVESNIRAELVVNPKRAILSLRFLKPVTDPLSTIIFSVNGRPLESQWFSFPTQGQSSEVVALLDLGDPDRADQIRDSKSMMLLLGATRKEYQHFVFGGYAATGSMFSPTSADPRELVSMVTMSAPLAEPSNLTAALLSAIISLEKTKGDRRAVLVFTDGHNDSAVTFDRVAEAAQAADVAISFILSSSSRSVDVPALVRLAERTGGNIVSADLADNFLRNPMQTIETGGTALAPFEQVRKYFWEKKTDVVASISFGQKTLDLVSPAEIKDANIMETVNFLARDSRAQIATASA
ncbi:MAG: hypothetical protein G4V63_29625, partial [Candidatus Afipia apatlaquensis]|nr:hypothetical protein [Candidatus Afipia apatlaquensis]